jgi:hypothetical protein
LGLLLGQILSPGATLVGQLTSTAGALASQIQQRAEEEKPAEGSSAAGDQEGAAAPAD